jgi:hypothetical protein
MQHWAVLTQSPGSSQPITPMEGCVPHSFPPAFGTQASTFPLAQQTLVLRGQLAPPQLMVGETQLPEPSHSSGPVVHEVRAATGVKEHAAAVLHTPKDAQRFVVIGAW